MSPTNLASAIVLMLALVPGPARSEDRLSTNEVIVQLTTRNMHGTHCSGMQFKFSRGSGRLNAPCQKIEAFPHPLEIIPVVDETVARVGSMTFVACSLGYVQVQLLANGTPKTTVYISCADEGLEFLDDVE